MTVKLPIIDGDQVVIWSHGYDNIRIRALMKSDGKYRWSLSVEECDCSNHEHEWVDRALLTPGGLSSLMINAVLSLRREQVSWIPDLAGDIRIPIRGSLIVASGCDWSVSLHAEDGDCHGNPLLSIKESRPLSAGEWISVWKNISIALTAYEDERYG